LKRRILAIGLVLFLIAVLAGCGSAAQDSATGLETVADADGVALTVTSQPVTIQVNTSGSTGLSGVAVSYLDGYWKGLGTTNSGGTVNANLPSGTWQFKAEYGGTSTQHTQNITSNPTVTFYTSEAKVVVKKHDNNPLSGVAISYMAGYYRGIGNTDGTGTASTEVFPGTYTFKADYGGTSATQDVAVPGDGKTAAQTITATFNPTKVTLYYAGTKQYFAGYWRGFTSTIILFPGTYSFKFGNYQTNIAVSGCSMSKVVNTLILKDHNGNPLSGGAARGGFGSNYGTWFVSGSTDANGVLLDIRDVGSQPTNMSYEMRYNGTTQVKTQDVSVNSVFQFQTILLTLRLETCGGTPLNGGNPRFGAGSTYTTSWFPGGLTGSSATGETAAEFFPGTYSFEMLYQATAEAKVSVVIPNANTKLTWQTTKVTLQYSGSISYGGGTGDSTWFTKPSMELLPGTYKFNFRGAGRMDLTLSACEFTRSAFALKLIDSGGSGITGGTGQYYDGGWQSIPGSTGSDGILLHAIPGLKNTLSFRMTHAGASQEKSQNIATNSIVVFQTKLVTFKLLDSNNNAITGAGTQYYAGGWKTFGGGNTTATMELLPLSYSFRASYAGASQEKSQNVGTNPLVQFQTTLVTMKLLHSDNATALSAGAQYYAGGWNTFGTSNTTATMELLPVSYSFRVSYAGASKEKSQNVGSDAVVVFQTGQVHSDSGKCTQYYASGWKAFTQDMELLPVSYAFRFSDFPETSYAIVAATTNHIH